MQTFQQLFNLLLNDIRIELNEEFDRNFERKAFFNTAWKPAMRNTTDSLLQRSGTLRKSIIGESANSPSAVITGNSIRWSSSVPYADIHNSGGKITVTPKMKGFFWYRFRIATGGDNKNLNPEALFWRAMALKPVGTTVVIPERKFIGWHPQVKQSIDEVTTEWFNNDVKNFIDNQLNNIIR